MTRHRRSGIPVGIAAAVALALAACGTSGLSIQPSMPATPVPTTAGPPEPCATAQIVNCPTPAGEYHASRIGAGITFQLIGAPWTNVAYTPQALTFMRGANWVIFMSGELNMLNGTTTEMVSDPGTAKLRLDSLPGITVRTGNPVSIDGHEAAVIDLINEGATTLLWHFGQTTDSYVLEAGAAARIHWIDLDGTPFILVVEAPKAEIAGFLAESQQVIDSLAFD